MKNKNKYTGVDSRWFRRLMLTMTATSMTPQRWLNAWIIRRRTKAFTDCGEPFKHLNGFSSLQMSMKKQAKWPEILGVKLPKKERKEK